MTIPRKSQRQALDCPEDLLGRVAIQAGVHEHRLSILHDQAGVGAAAQLVGVIRQLDQLHGGLHVDMKRDT